MEILKQGNWQGLNIEKLKGQNDVFRCRVGNFRIIFTFVNNSFGLLEVSIRNEATYRNF
jgi:mRNA-degrading endonuclease RelE of RelBE toxin-antitoxin system